MAHVAAIAGAYGQPDTCPFSTIHCLWLWNWWPVPAGAEHEHADDAPLGNAERRAHPATDSRALYVAIEEADDGQCVALLRAFSPHRFLSAECAADLVAIG